MKIEKRNIKNYKSKDSHYHKARKRAEKEYGSLVGLIEDVVIAYGAGHNISIKPIKKGIMSLDEIVAIEKLNAKINRL